MSIKWSRKLPCLCQHSPAPTLLRTAIREGSLGSMFSSSPRRKGRASSRTVDRFGDGDGDEPIFFSLVLCVMEEG